MWDARGDSARLTSATSRLKLDMQGTLTRPVKVEQKIDGKLFPCLIPLLFRYDIDDTQIENIN